MLIVFQVLLAGIDHILSQFLQNTFYIVCVLVIEQTLVKWKQHGAVRMGRYQLLFGGKGSTIASVKDVDFLFSSARLCEALNLSSLSAMLGMFSRSMFRVFRILYMMIVYPVGLLWMHMLLISW